jgi:hypothetical protein
MRGVERAVINPEHGANMAANSNDRTQSRLEKAARESAGLSYEVEARAVREKMARLRALRLAKEEADKAAGTAAPASGKKRAKPALRDT